MRKSEVRFPRWSAILIAAVLGVLAGCGAGDSVKTDAGPDADAVDLGDVPEGWPAPSCDVETGLAGFIGGNEHTLAPIFPDLFHAISAYDPEGENRHDSTYIMRADYLRPGGSEMMSFWNFRITTILVEPETGVIWFSESYLENGRVMSPKIYRWDVAAKLMEERTPPELRSEACAARDGVVHVQRVDTARNRLLVSCAVTTELVTGLSQHRQTCAEVYFIDLTTGEKTFLGRLAERCYLPGDPYPEPFDPAYYHTRCAEWDGPVVEAGWSACYWKIDGETPELVLRTSEANADGGFTAQPSAGHRVFHARPAAGGFEVTSTDLATGDVEVLAATPVFPENLAPAGKLVPQLVSWQEGYRPSLGADGLRARWTGHLFLTDIETHVTRQVTCLKDAPWLGRRAHATLFPGDTGLQWLLITVEDGDTVNVYLKDLRAAGILSGIGHLIPAPARKAHR